MTSAPHTDATGAAITATTAAAEAAVLAAWQAWVREGFLQAGHLKAIGNDRALMAENHYAAFLAGWAAASPLVVAEARADERQRIRDEIGEHLAMCDQREHRCCAEQFAGLLDGDTP